MRRDGKNMAKVKRFCRTARRWLRPVALALLLLFALALGRSDVFERLAPTPEPKTVRSGNTGNTHAACAAAGRAGYARLDFALWRALSRHVQL